MPTTRRVGLTANTPDRIVMDAGQLWENYGESNARLIGATRGGSVFTIAQEFRQVEVDGVIGDVKGLKRIINVAVTLTATLLEFSDKNWQLLLSGSTRDNSDANHVKFTRDSQLEDSHYVANVALVASVGGQSNPIVCMVKNALQTGELALTTGHNDEGVMPVTFMGHYTTTDPTDEPWEIWHPKS